MKYLILDLKERMALKKLFMRFPIAKEVQSILWLQCDMEPDNLDYDKGGDIEFKMGYMEANFMRQLIDQEMIDCPCFMRQFRQDCPSICECLGLGD